MGRSGETFISEMSNNKGVHVLIVLDLAKIDAAHATAIVAMRGDRIGPEQVPRLIELKRRVRLIGAK